jgi:NADPH-dependent ferric siderophore reductase
VTVEGVDRLSAGTIRIVFGGAALEGFEAGTFTDHYVKLHLPPPRAPYGPPFDPVGVREGLPRELWPRTRTYTVRAWDPTARRLTIDFVVHGAEGIAGPWAARARPGDVLQLLGPGGAYAPDSTLGCHLFVGDESALPAIAASLERVVNGATVHVVAQVPSEAHCIPLPGELAVRWLFGDDPDDVLAEVRGIDLPAGDGVQAFVHGEAALVRAVRRHLIAERGIPRERLSASGYWKRNRTEEGWREDKPEWKRLVEADLEAAT